MVSRIIKWLEYTSLNHAAIVLLTMYPTIRLHELIGGGAWTAALMWIAVYYSREVSMSQRSGRDVRAFWPGNWSSFHDKIQTLYLAIVAIAWALGYSLL